MRDFKPSFCYLIKSCLDNREAGVNYPMAAKTELEGCHNNAGIYKDCPSARQSLAGAANNEPRSRCWLPWKLCYCGALQALIVGGLEVAGRVVRACLSKLRTGKGVCRRASVMSVPRPQARFPGFAQPTRDTSSTTSTSSLLLPLTLSSPP